MVDVTVYLTDEGEERVGESSIDTTDEDIQYHEEYIVITSRWRTFILYPEDIDFVL
jgi:hypothetical protein